MLRMTCGRVRSYSSNGASPCHASSQTDRPSSDVASRTEQAALAGHEVALLVEHAEVRELDLVIALLHAAVLDQRGGVVESLFRPIHEPHHHRTRRSGGRDGKRVERGQVVLDEARTKDQVLGRIPGDRELGEADEVGALLGRARGPLGHARDVAVEIADGRVQLAERDAHHDRKPTRRDAQNPWRGALLGSADVDVVRLPHEVGAFLPMTHDCADQALEVIPCVVRRPGVALDLSRI